MKKSFTVTELLVVIAIVVILAGILIGGIGYAGRRADDAKTAAAIQTLSVAFDAYRAEKGFYPPCTTAQDVKFYRKTETDGKINLYLVLGTTEHKFVDKQGKAFLDLNGITATAKNKAEPFTDAWNNAIKYQCPGAHNKAAFDLSSKGRDGKDSTTDDKLDDITNWNNASHQ